MKATTRYLKRALLNFIAIFIPILLLVSVSIYSSTRLEKSSKLSIWPMNAKVVISMRT